jgi:uncharacterized BrkB/YihY/UPF0761 family membrane protein
MKIIQFFLALAYAFILGLYAATPEHAEWWQWVMTGTLLLIFSILLFKDNPSK